MKESRFPDWSQALNQAQIPARQEQSIVWLPPAQVWWPSWKVDFLTTVRRRHCSYRNGQRYQVWIERFARQAKAEGLEKLGETDIPLSWTVWRWMNGSVRWCPGEPPVPKGPAYGP